MNSFSRAKIFIEPSPGLVRRPSVVAGSPTGSNSVNAAGA